MTIRPVEAYVARNRESIGEANAEAILRISDDAWPVVWAAAWQLSEKTFGPGEEGIVVVTNEPAAEIAEKEAARWLKYEKRTVLPRALTIKGVQATQYFPLKGRNNCSYMIIDFSAFRVMLNRW